MAWPRVFEVARRGNDLGALLHHRRGYSYEQIGLLQNVRKGVGEMVTSTKRPTLTVATAAGAQRGRMQRLLNRLAAQTIAADIEVVVVDTRPWLDGIDLPSGLDVTVVPGSTFTFGQARAEAARAARADVVAYLEDHCYPEPRWAEALTEAYREPWASVGYALANANPETRRSRITHLAHYGQWESPRPGRTGTLPGNNVSYRRQVLLDLGPDLAAMLMADHNIHARLRRQDLPFATEPGARVQHENPLTLTDACRGSATYSRVLAAERARFEGWGRGHRLARAVMILWSAPLARLAGLVGATRRRPRRLIWVAVYLPGILAEYLSGALGESVGYLLGPGRGAARMMYWEVDAPRAAEP